MKVVDNLCSLVVIQRVAFLVIECSELLTTSGISSFDHCSATSKQTTSFAEVDLSLSSPTLNLQTFLAANY